MRVSSGFIDKIRRVFLPRFFLVASLQTHHPAQSPVCANVCRHLASSAAAAASKSTWWWSTGKRSKWCVGTIFLFLCHCRSGHPTQVKNRHLSALNKRRRLKWCTSMLQLLSEAKRPHSSTSLARHTFLEVSMSFSLLFQAIFTPFFVVQFHASPKQFLGCLESSW